MELRKFRCSSFSTEGITYIPKAAITLGIGPHFSYYYHDNDHMVIIVIIIVKQNCSSFSLL